MINVYDTANQLEKDLRESQEYKDLQAVVAKVKADDATFAVYKKLREAQKTLQEQQMQGTLDEKVMKSLQEISQEASQYPLMMELMEKERAISVLIDDLNKIILNHHEYPFLQYLIDRFYHHLPHPKYHSSIAPKQDN